MSNKPKKLNVIPLWICNIISLSLILIFSEIIVFSYFLFEAKLAEDQAVLSERSLVPPSQLVVNPFGNIAMRAKSAVVYDATNEKIIFGVNENSQLPLASLTKLMTSLVASRFAPDFTVITIPPDIKEFYGELRPGDGFLLKDIINFTMVSSSNVGASAIASAIGAVKSNIATTTDVASKWQFVTLMNQTANEVGLQQSYYLNDTGLDTGDNTGGAYGSAIDTAKLITYIVKNYPDILKSTIKTEIEVVTLSNRKIKAENTNPGVQRFPGLIGSKTGLTDLAGGNLALVFDAGFNELYAIVVLGSTEEDRFLDAEQLYNATIEYLGSQSYLQ